MLAPEHTILKPLRKGEEAASRGIRSKDGFRYCLPQDAAKGGELPGERSENLLECRTFGLRPSPHAQ